LLNHGEKACVLLVNDSHMPLNDSHQPLTLPVPTRK
jgi:hypothetical protein